MLTVMNKGVNTCCKSVTTLVLTAVGLLVDLGAEIAEPKSSLGASPYIR